MRGFHFSIDQGVEPGTASYEQLHPPHDVVSACMWIFTLKILYCFFTRQLLNTVPFHCRFLSLATTFSYIILRQ